MKRTTVMLPAELKAKAMRAARERGISFGELLRRALTATVEAPPAQYEDSAFADAAVFDGPAPADLSEGHDGYLYGGDG